MVMEGDMAARLMGIVAAGLMLWVALSAPQDSHAGEEPEQLLLRSQAPLSCERISGSSLSEAQVCSPSSNPARID